MTPTKTLFFAVILAALLGYIYTVEVPRKAAEERALLPLGEATKTSLTSVTIKNGEGEIHLINTAPSSNGKGTSKSETDSADSMKGENVDGVETFGEDPLGKWELSEVKGSKLDSGSLSALLTALLDLKLDSKIAPEDVGSDLSIYGLDKPAITLEVKNGDKVTTLAIGKSNEFVGKRYVSVSGHEGLYLGSEALFTSANKKRNDLREKNPFKFSDLGLTRVKFSSSEGVIKLEQGDDYKWKIVEPGPYTGSSTAISELIRKIQNFTTTEFIDLPEGMPQEELGKYGLASPSFFVSFEYKDENGKASSKNREFQFGKSPTDNSLSGLVTGVRTVYKLPPEAFPSIAKPVEELREKQLAKFDVTSAEKVEFVLASEPNSSTPPITIEKVGDGYKVGEKDADSPFVTALLNDISDLSAISFPRVNRDYGFGTPTLKISVKLKGPPGKEAEGKTHTIIVGAKAAREDLPKDYKGEAYYAGVNDLKEPFILSDESVKKASPKVETLVKSAAS